MLKNKPFEKLLLPYLPIPRLNHFPLIMRFGFVIPQEFTEFLRVALENKLGDPKKFSNPDNFYSMADAVLSHLNK